MSEPSDQLLPFSRFGFYMIYKLTDLPFYIGLKFFFFLYLVAFDSELIIIFLKFLYDQDPVRKLLELSDVENPIEVDL